MFKTRISGLAIALSLLLIPSIPSLVAAADEVEEVVAIGTRREARSVGDSPAPVDIISGSDFTNQGAADLPDMIRTLVPSFNVNTQPISDAATLIRPANLRGLPPDNMLVLVNGKRRHRGAVISFLGSGISDGAQGPDISAIPSIALKQVEVLRDGAAAQYGSDAIVPPPLPPIPRLPHRHRRRGAFHHGAGREVIHGGRITPNERTRGSA